VESSPDTTEEWIVWAVGGPEEDEAPPRRLFRTPVTKERAEAMAESWRKYWPYGRTFAVGTLDEAPPLEEFR
jgi:hypothetical protein